MPVNVRLAGEELPLDLQDGNARLRVVDGATVNVDLNNIILLLLLQQSREHGRLEAQANRAGTVEP